MAVKYERITLWTAFQTYTDNDQGMSALDYLIPALSDSRELGECQILDYDSEDYHLAKTDVPPANS
jgi:hypothetical protein